MFFLHFGEDCLFTIKAFLLANVQADYCCESLVAYSHSASLTWLQLQLLRTLEWPANVTLKFVHDPAGLGT